MNFNNIIKITRLKERMLSSIISGTVLIACLSSCVDESLYNHLDGNYDGEELTVPVSLSVAPMTTENPETRAIEYITATDEEKRIHDFWILEYHENGTRIGLPRYYTEDNNGNLPKNINIIIPRRDEDKFTCVMIANSNDPNLFNHDNTARYSTLDDLRKFEMSTHNQQHVFNPTENKYLLMSGWTTITTDPKTHALSFDLIRNVCKINMRLTAFDDDELVYKYFEWVDVPLGKVFPHGRVDYTQHVSRDWPQHKEDDPTENLKRADLENGIDFYLPCNFWLPEGPMMPGATPGESVVKEDFTHFSIVCRKKEGVDGDGNIKESEEQYAFSLYPSGAVDSQFEFKPNHSYKMEIAINGIPDDSPFVTVIGYNYLEEESNCYMLRRDTKESYALPLTRINKFWENETGEPALTDDTEWVAEVIWQDTPIRLIDFASYRGFEVAPDKSYLEGVGDTAFAFRTTAHGEGNVIVGVRKKVDGWENIPVEEREYLWSWHLWITEYSPDDMTDEGPYNWYYKEVLGGAVHRYPATNYWQTDGANQYVMDRDLGAKFTFDKTDLLDEIYYHFMFMSTPDWTYKYKEIYPTFGLYYQYGRKDPFPYSEGAYPDNPKDDEKHNYPQDGIQMVYDINGEVIPAFSKHTTMLLSKPNEGSFEKAVKHPYVFYTISPESRFWHDPGVGADEEVEAWLAPDWGDTDKSFYDPCPPGWRVIQNITVYGNWSDATLQDRVHHYMETSSFNLGSIIDLGDGHNAFYPASGRRDGVYGKIDYESDKEDESEYKHYFRFWTFSGLSEWWLASGDFDQGNFEDGDKTNVFSLWNWNYTTGEPAGVALPVRCIRDLDYEPSLKETR